jgi:hypothetical protein
MVHNSMHVFFKLPRPVHRPLKSDAPFLPPLYKHPVGPGLYGTTDPANPSEYLRELLHQAVACDLCMERISGPWYWCVYCAKDLCEQHEQVDTHDPTHVFVKYKGEVDTRAFQYVSSRTISLRIQLTMGSSQKSFHQCGSKQLSAANRTVCGLLHVVYVSIVV